jgi:hypothetical protein
MPRDSRIIVRMSARELRDLDTIVSFQRGTRSEISRAAIRSMIMSIRTNFLGLPQWMRDQHPEMQALSDRHDRVPNEDSVDIDISHLRQNTSPSFEVDDSPLVRPDTTPRRENLPSETLRERGWTPTLSDI